MSTPTSTTADPDQAGGTGLRAVSRTTPLWRQLGLLVQWQFRRSLPMLPLFIIVQTLLSVSMVLGYGLIVGHPGREASLYLAGGGPAVALISVGLIMTPQWVSQSRTEGSLDWMRTLPVPRVAFLLADLAIWTALALPGLVVGVLVANARFDVDLAPQWWLVPGAVLVALTAACIGYAIATLLAPALAQILSQVLAFGIMLFSPVSFPADRLPDWAQEIHRWLPFEPMAQVVRAGLFSHDATMPIRSWILLGGWCLVAVAGASWALGRRP